MKIIGPETTDSQIFAESIENIPIIELKNEQEFKTLLGLDHLYDVNLDEVFSSEEEGANENL
jgi:hypothetical protein